MDLGSNPASPPASQPPSLTCLICKMGKMLRVLGTTARPESGHDKSPRGPRGSVNAQQVSLPFPSPTAKAFPAATGRAHHPRIVLPTRRTLSHLSKPSLKQDSSWEAAMALGMEPSPLLTAAILVRALGCQE